MNQMRYRARVLPADNYRTLGTSALQRVEGEGNQRKFLLSFSSEEPVECWFGREILDHAEGAADLTRLNEIGCLLFNHNQDDVIGRINRAWIEKGRGCAEVVFDSDERSELILQKVHSGTLRGVSVGYRFLSFPFRRTARLELGEAPRRAGTHWTFTSGKF